MTDWFDTPLGHSLLTREREHCRALVPSGYYPSALQAGRASLDFLDGIEIGNRFFIGTRAPQRDSVNSDTPMHCAIAAPSAMPFTDKTHNLIVLPHTLDFCDDPHAVLREVNQILIPQGCVVITGFNQMSLFGAARVLMKMSATASKRVPWSGRYHRVGRVQDWLALLGFELVGAAMLCYQPPLQNEHWRRKFAFIDAAGARWWPALGAAYIIVARKQEAAMTRRAARMRWRRFIHGMAPQPVAHRIHFDASNRARSSTNVG